jgi:hypothetical protein
MATDSAPDILLAAAAFAGALEQLSIRYVVGGSFASSLHGEPRSTNDIDIVADIHAGDAIRIVESLGDAFYVSLPAIDEAIAHGASFNAIHLATSLKVDVFIAGDDPLDQQRLRNPLSVLLPAATPVRLPIDTVEHIVLRKLEWYRRGGGQSERQWRDVIGVLRLQAEAIDWAYVNGWAVRIGLVELLERARTEAER